MSDRIRNEQALAESRNRYRLLAEYSSDVVLLLVGRRHRRVGVTVDPRDARVGSGRARSAAPSPTWSTARTRPGSAALRRHPAGQSATRSRRSGSGASVVATCGWRATEREVRRPPTGALVNRVVAHRRHPEEGAGPRCPRGVGGPLPNAGRKRLRCRARLRIRTVDMGLPVDRLGARLAAGRSGGAPGGLDVIAPADRDRATAATAQVGADGAPELQEIRFLTATGEARWMQVHSRAVDAVRGRTTASSPVCRTSTSAAPTTSMREALARGRRRPRRGR